MTRLPRKSVHAPPAAGQVRIIGGHWRNTRLPVVAAAGLRPTSDRVRETLFNWLLPVLPGACVLDAFAGTGALGLEAVSRGAASALLVERDRALSEGLREVVSRLGATDRVQVVQADVLTWLGTQPGAGFDIAFVDPPFADGVWERALPAIDRVLSPHAWLYVESPVDRGVALPGWHVHREGATRDVRYALWRRSPGAIGQ